MACGDGCFGNLGHIRACLDQAAAAKASGAEAPGVHSHLVYSTDFMAAPATRAGANAAAAAESLAESKAAGPSAVTFLSQGLQSINAHQASMRQRVNLAAQLETAGTSRAPFCPRAQFEQPQQQQQPQETLSSELEERQEISKAQHRDKRRKMTADLERQLAALRRQCSDPEPPQQQQPQEQPPSDPSRSQGQQQAGPTQPQPQQQPPAQEFQADSELERQIEQQLMGDNWSGDTLPQPQQPPNGPLLQAADPRQAADPQPVEDLGVTMAQAADPQSLEEQVGMCAKCGKNVPSTSGGEGSAADAQRECKCPRCACCFDLLGDDSNLKTLPCLHATRLAEQ
jgi:hypothetical protein